MTGGWEHLWQETVSTTWMGIQGFGSIEVDESCGAGERG